MLAYPSIDPVAFHLGPLEVHWYGLMYLLGFAMAWGLGVYRANKHGLLTNKQVEDLIFYENQFIFLAEIVPGFFQ